MAAALLLRLWLAFGLNHWSHPTDIVAFGAWANMLASNGFAAFYTPYPVPFTDYPPGYMYILAMIGNISEWLGLGFGTPAHGALIKLPAMMFDIATVAFIYKIAVNFNKHRNFAAAAALIYAFNPAIILNSAVWGQVDSIHTFLLVVSIYFIGRRKMLPSVLLFAVSILVKPQSFIFAPIYLFMFYKYIIGENLPEFNPQKNWQRFRRLALYGLACFALMALLILPFIDFSALPAVPPVLTQYISTFTTYPFITHNAYNFWALLGLNTADLTLSFNILGFGFLAILTAFAIYLLSKKNDVGHIFLVGAVLIIGTFLLSIRMHERYNFPAMVMLLLAYVSLRDKRLLWAYAGYSAAQFLNNFDVLLMSLNGFNRAQIEYSAVIFAIPIVAISIYVVYLAVRMFAKKRKQAAPKTSALLTKRRDIVVCAAITVFYAIFAFTNLGNAQSPQSRFDGAINEAVVVDFGATQDLTIVQHMLGARNDQTFILEFSMDMINWHDSFHFAIPNTFAWDFHETIGIRARFARITPTSHNFIVQEMGFRDAGFNLVPVNVVSATGHQLFDEQHLVPAQLRDYMHSAYFDEIYHPRTAYEFIHNMEVYEWTHPPLGKVIMSWGIQIFGMTPFGWRFAGAFFGVLMLPLIYAFAKALFAKSENSTLWAAFATFVFAFDFMHYAQTRLATIDTYVVFFIMGMYYFMYRYSQMNFFREKLSKTLWPLLFCGIFLGLAAASKWQGLYGAFGIAVIFFWVLAQRYLEYRRKTKDGRGKEGLWDRDIGVYANFWKKAVITCAACVGFFIAIPVIIYVLSYIPYWNTGYLSMNIHTGIIDAEMGFLQAVWQNQLDMFNYHAGLDAEHAFASSWWQWIINYRPIFIYANSVGVPHGLAQGISSFGNPLVWWGGIAALIYCVYAGIRRKDKVAIFLVIAWLSQILPWVFVPRIAWIYHYFPNVPFIVLMLAYALKSSRVFENKFFTTFFGNRKNVAMAFAIACFGLFVLFYPVLTGTPISREFVETYLRWLPSWVLLV
jgi:dolichyl-phosphate-mannose--protein O-mannosyl transferase